MTPEEFAIARKKLEWTDVQLAAELGVTEKAVRGWADGSLKIPKQDAKRIEWEAALAEREAALRAAGIPECPWVKAWDAEQAPEGEKEILAHFKRLDEHAEQCSTCREREQFLKERFPPLPELPAPGGLSSAFQWWARWLKRFPEWTHPVFNGAAIVGMLTGIRVLFAIPRRASPAMLIALPVGVALGAVAGLVYSAVRTYIAAGGVRKILAYVLVLAAYLSLLAPFGAYGGDDLRFSPTGAIVTLSILSVIFLLWLLGRRKTN